MAEKRKRKPTHKTTTLVVRVRYPAFLTAAQLRKEVRTLINHGTNWTDTYVVAGEWHYIETGDIRAAAVQRGRKEDR